MKNLLRVLPVLMLASLLGPGSALAGPFFNTDASINAPSSGNDTASVPSGPSFNAEPSEPVVSDPSAESTSVAVSQPPQEFLESKTECRWLTSSINPLRKSYVDDAAGQTEYVEFEFRYQFTNRSDDRVFTGLKDALLVLTCTVETPAGKANVEMRYSNPLRMLKKQRGPGDKVVVLYTLKADESCVVSKDEGVTWQEIALKLPSDWWGYKITHQYSVISQKD